MAVQFRDYYDVLDVARIAMEDEIKQASRRLACTYHPDVNAGDATAEEKFTDAGEASAVLSRKQLWPQCRAHRVPAHQQPW
jgi:DnaJ-class molecular chaperone